MLSLDQIKAGAKAQDLADMAPAGFDDVDNDAALDLARAELDGFQDDALEETQEDLSFALGGRLRDGGDKEGVRARVLTQKLVAEIATVEPVTLASVLDGPRDWQHSPNILTALRAQFPDPGQIALQLAAHLAHGGLDRRLRRRLEGALAELAGDDKLAIELFGALEFGVNTPALRQELRRLYQRANLSGQKLSQWLEALGPRAQRQRKLRTMLRVLSYELAASGQAIVGSHLAAVVGDLQQLLRLIGLEAHCDQAAAALAIPALNGETLLHSVVSLVEQLWVDEHSIREAIPALPGGLDYRVGRALARLLQLLPDNCYTDAEQRAQIHKACQRLCDSVAEQAAGA